MSQIMAAIKTNRKTFVFFIIAALICLFPFELKANAVSETITGLIKEKGLDVISDDVSPSIRGIFEPTGENMNPTTVFMNMFATSINSLSEGICMSITPYPKAIEVFYPNLFDSNQKSKWDTYTIDNDDVFMSSGAPTLGGNSLNKAVSTKSDDSQKATTRMLMIVIGSLFLIDMLFSIIYTYVTGGEEPVLKTILVKFVMAILIGALIMALPFVIEALRFGFSRAVLYMANISGNPDIEYIYTYVSNEPIFHYPGMFLKLTTSMLSNLDPDNVGVIDMFEDSGLFMGAINRGLCRLLFVIARLVICVLSIFTAMHILWNVMEIYILISLGLILLPWQLFNPLSFIGKGVFRSLVSNIVQLTVILFIMVAVMPVTFYVSHGLWENLTDSDTPNMVFMITNLEKNREQASILLGSDRIRTLLGTDGMIMGKDDQRNDVEVTADFLNHVGMLATVQHLKTGEGFQSTVKETITIKWYMLEGCDVDKFAMFSLNDDLTQKIGDKILKGIQEAYKTTILEHPQVKGRNTYKDSFKPTLANCKEDVKKKLLGGISWNNFSGIIKQSFGLNYENVSTSMPSEGWGRAFFYLSAALMLCIMPNYFVTRSSQIANGLLDGRDSGADFAGLMQSRFLNRAASATVKVAAAPIRIAGKSIDASIKTASANKAEKMSQDGHSVMGAVLKTATGAGQSAREFAAGVSRNRDSLESATPSQSSGDPTGTNNQTKNQ